MEEPYLLKYREYEAENLTKGTKIISLESIKVLAFDPSPISHDNESSRMTKFNLIGFSRMKP